MAARAVNTLIDELGAYKGWAWPTAAQREWCLARLNEACRRFKRGVYTDEEGVRHVHAFSFLQPSNLAVSTTTLTLWPTATGTMTVATVTITAAAAAFYPSMIGHILTADTSGTTYTITAYTSSTVVTVNTSAAADDGDTFTVTATGTYRLPSDWGGAIGPPVYTNAASNSDDLEEVTPEDMDRLYRDDATTGDPEKWCISVPTPVTTGQSWNARFHPVPSTALTVQWPHKVIVADLTDSSAVYPVGGEEHNDTILWCAKAAAEFLSDRKPGAMEYMANQMMRDSAAIDRGLYASADTQDSIGWEA
jgi:hypothetical protein